MDPARCLVVEDAPNGILSGNAAGCKTLGLLTTHAKEHVEAVSPTFLVKDLSRLAFDLGSSEYCAHSVYSVSMKISPNGGVDVTIRAE